ncbi:MAG TPA: heme o synthase [Thermoanaerobaculia bacterium]|jgi:protoheme IX farnesyltransferase|nr:heme o synthase [Thermoanaerobaculia bacterium]
MRDDTMVATASVRLRDLLGLTKSGITAMVAVSTAAGMLLARNGASPPLALWVHTLLGTALVAAAASALNQVVEREQDALMRRTAQRPLPAGRLQPDVALLCAGVLGAVGLLELALGANLLAAALAAATLVGYVGVYTPLKRVSSLSTIVGAVPGAVPPMIGWAAVRGTLDPGAWALFALLFFWQMPHFLSIAWLYRADYARGGFPMLSVNDPDGLRTSRQALLYCAALVPVSLLPAAIGLAGGVYFFGALAAGAWFFAATAAFALDRSAGSAKRLMLVSVFYLPVVLTALAADRLL